MSLRPSISRTWIHDFGFSTGISEYRPAPSLGIQTGIFHYIHPKLRLFYGVGYFHYGEKIIHDYRNIQVNPNDDPYFQSLNSIYETNRFYHFLELPFRCDYFISRSATGLVLGLGLTPSLWLLGRYNTTIPIFNEKRGSLNPPATRVIIAGEVHAGWVWKMSSNIEFDTRLFLMADGLDFNSGNQVSRMTLGMQLGILFGK